MSNKTEVFKNELFWIGNSDIRSFVSEQIDRLPDYFFEVAASSTGKYHPSYALGEGGLVRHTKAAVAIAKDLLGLEMYGKYSAEDKDIILAALILHDGMKHGTVGGKYTVATHPTEMADFIQADCAKSLGKKRATSCILLLPRTWASGTRITKRRRRSCRSHRQRFKNLCINATILPVANIWKSISTLSITKVIEYDKARYCISNIYRHEDKTDGHV